ncbi:MAG: hypothetical protein M5U34_35485 [Chloroflexi bacterium]|nr:hypothetical protein [Chloroflexota bacterium]
MPLNKDEDEDAAEDDFDFAVSTDDLEPGLAEDIPDWLLGSSGTEELEAPTLKDLAGDEIADELADWVATIQPDELDEIEEDSLDWLAESPEMRTLREDEPSFQRGRMTLSLPRMCLPGCWIPPSN